MSEHHLVFDRGTIRRTTLRISTDPLPFHGSLVPTQHQDLLNIPLEQFRSLEDSRFAGVRVYRTEKEVFGRKRTIVITRSRALLRAKSGASAAFGQEASRSTGSRETDRSQP